MQKYTKWCTHSQEHVKQVRSLPVVPSLNNLAYIQTTPCSHNACVHHTMHISNNLMGTQELSADHLLNAEAGGGAALVIEQHLFNPKP